MRVLCCAVFSVVFSPFTHSSTIQISGVEESIVLNIKARLEELAKNQVFTPYSNKELRFHVNKAIQPYGYFHSHITIISQQPLRIHINPGAPVRIESMQVEIKGEGSKQAVFKKLFQPMPLKKGDKLNTITYEKLKQQLIDTAENQGYLHAFFEKTEIMIQPEENKARIHLIFNTGQQTYFGEVQFNTTYLSSELLRRYLPFHYGEIYSTDKVLTLNNDLATSGYFSSVSIKPQLDNSNTYIPIQAHLKPAPRINYSLGVGYGTDTGLRGRLGYHLTPVNTQGHKFNAIALGSFKENALQGQYIIPGTNPSTDQYIVMGNLGHLNYNTGSSNSLLTSLAQQHSELNYQRNLSLNGLFERYNYFDQPRERKNSLFPKLGFTWKNNNNKLFSPSGYNLTLNGLGASKAILSEVSFAQTSLNIKAALTVESLRTRFYLHSLGGITAINDIQQMPLSLAFLLGGSDNLRGYSYNSLGPGKIVIFSGFEIQKETVNNWYFTGFLDLGDVYKPIPHHVKQDVGMGLMWVSPVGPIKLGIAQAIDNHFNRNSRNPKLVISMGPDL